MRKVSKSNKSIFPNSIRNTVNQKKKMNVISMIMLFWEFKISILRSILAVSAMIFNGTKNHSRRWILLSRRWKLFVTDKVIKNCRWTNSKDQLLVKMNFWSIRWKLNLAIAGHLSSHKPRKTVLLEEFINALLLMKLQWKKISDWKVD